jgi:hypothetical protein
MRILCLFVLLTLPLPALTQQIPDSSFQFKPVRPMYSGKNGTVVYVDEAHNNFHTLSTRYFTFGEVLKNDGYRVRPFTESFTSSSLAKCKILVIANALPDAGSWALPTPSAFTPAEVATLHDWVQNGGSLFLIADHMPCPGAARDIGKSLGINLYNGYALYQKQGFETFTRASETLHSNLITNGRSTEERVDSITIFGGHAFLPTRLVHPIIRFSDDHKVFFPAVAGDFTESTPVIDASGLYHSIFFTEGKGKVVIVAEAAMFSAQLAGQGRARMGMNAPEAKQNPQLLLNIIHWLDGVLK